MNLFSVIGINYESADFQKRNEFALNPDQQRELLVLLNEAGYHSVMLLSTCNRTEIYTFCENPNDVLKIWLTFLGKDVDLPRDIIYTHQSIHALRHLCTVTSGAASQIPGDYEIVSQVKKAFVQSQKMGLINGRLEKIVNTAIRVSKRVKTETEFSSGTSSVSYAVAQKIRNGMKSPDEKVLIIGMGKMGSACTKHLCSLLPNLDLTITNRSDEKAEALAKKLEINFMPFSSLENVLKFDHVVLATQAEDDILFAYHFASDMAYNVYDMTMPTNVNASVAHMENVCLRNIDEISFEVKKHIARRIKDLPKVHDIVEEELIEIGKWWQIKQVISSHTSESDVKQKIHSIRKKVTSAEKLFREKLA